MILRKKHAGERPILHPCANQTGYFGNSPQNQNPENAEEAEVFRGAPQSRQLLTGKRKFSGQRYNQKNLCFLRFLCVFRFCLSSALKKFQQRGSEPEGLIDIREMRRRQMDYLCAGYPAGEDFPVSRPRRGLVAVADDDERGRLDLRQQGGVVEIADASSTERTEYA